MKRFLLGIIALVGFWSCTDPVFAAELTRGMMLGGSGAVVSASVANYIPVQGTFTAAAVAAEGNVMVVAPFPGVAKNLRCVTMTAGGVVTAAGGTSYVFALDDGAATPTTLTCTETALLTGCTDSTHSVSVATGDLLDIQVTPAGTPTALAVKCSMEFDTIY